MVLRIEKRACIRRQYPMRLEVRSRSRLSVDVVMV